MNEKREALLIDLCEFPFSKKKNIFLLLYLIFATTISYKKNLLVVGWWVFCVFYSSLYFMLFVCNFVCVFCVSIKSELNALNDILKQNENMFQRQYSLFIVL